MKVSVVMPVYNAEEYLEESIESILNQTFKDFEFLIIDDKSDDKSVEIIKKYAEDDSRIKILENKYKKGIVGALNTGIDEAKWEYIARMDADDISLPERFEKQVAFLDANPEIGFLGTHWKQFGEFEMEYPVMTDEEEIKIASLFMSTFCHPSVMMRKFLLDKNKIRYQREYEFSEDFKLWNDLLKVTKGTNLPDLLVKYRTHHKNTSISKQEKQIDTWAKAMNQNLEETFGITMQKDLYDGFYYLLMMLPKEFDPEWKSKIISFFEELEEINKKKNIFDNDLFNQKIGELKFLLQSENN